MIRPPTVPIQRLKRGLRIAAFSWPYLLLGPNRLISRHLLPHVPGFQKQSVFDLSGSRFDAAAAGSTDTSRFLTSTPI